MNDMTDIETMCQNVLDNPDFKPNELELALACQSNFSFSFALELGKVIPESLISEIVLNEGQNLSSIFEQELNACQKEAFFMLCKIWSMLMLHFNKREDLVVSWLKRSKRPLSGQSPTKLMQSIAGGQAVLGIIERLNTGDFS